MTFTFSAHSVVDGQKIKEDISKEVNGAQAGLDALILQDSNFFVPVKTGTLQKSAITNSRLGSGQIEWNTPYARRLYYEYTKPEYQANPSACRLWFEAAKARYSAKWEKFVNDYIKR